MTRYTGDQSRTGYFFESGTYGTASGTLQWLGDVQSFTAAEDMKYKNIHYHGTASRNVDQQISLGKAYAGTVTYYPTRWSDLVYVLGSNVDTSGTVSTHVISELNGGNASPWTAGGDNPFPSIQLYNAQNTTVAGSNFIRQYAGVNVKAWTLTIPQGDMLSVKMDWVAQSVTFSSGAVAAITADTLRPFVTSDVKLHLPSGTVLSLMNTATVSINNNLSAKQYANGSVYVGTPIVGWRDYMINPGIDADSTWGKTLYTQYFQGGSSFNVLLEVTASGNRTALFGFSGCQLQGMDSPVALAPVNQETLKIVPQNLTVNVSDGIPRYNGW